jgi:hypothetical protein
MNEHHARVADDRGAGLVAAFIIVTAVMVLAGGGLLIDGSHHLAAEHHATTVAFEAARVGAQDVDPAAVRDSTDATGYTLDLTSASTAATAAAERLLPAGGRVIAVTVTAQSIRVVVSEPVTPTFPFLGPTTVTGTGEVRLGVGVTHDELTPP